MNKVLATAAHASTGRARLGGVQIVCLNWVAGFMANILMDQSRISKPCMRKSHELSGLSRQPQNKSAHSVYCSFDNVIL